MAGKEVDLATALNRRATHKDFKPIVRLAFEHGWTGHVKSSGGLEMLSPDKKANAYFPNSTKNTGAVARTLRSRILRWAALRDVDPTVDGLTDEHFEGVEFTLSPPGVKGTSAKCNEHGLEFVSWDGLSSHIRTEHPAITEDDIEVEVVPAQEETKDAMPRTMSTVEIVRKPWFAQASRAGGGEVKTYQSETVGEVHVGGALSFYECLFEGCDYSNETNPRSVSTHYGKKHVESGEAPKVVVGDTSQRRKWEPKYGEASALSDAITRDIYLALRRRKRHVAETDSSYSKALGELIVKEYVEAGYEASWRPDAPSPEEKSTLQQIRDLLEMPNTEAEMFALGAQLAEAQSRAETAEAQAVKARDILRTMAELATEESSE